MKVSGWADSTGYHSADRMADDWVPPTEKKRAVSKANTKVDNLGLRRAAQWVVMKADHSVSQWANWWVATTVHWLVDAKECPWVVMTAVHWAPLRVVGRADEMVA
jgi:hypothetical protein